MSKFATSYITNAELRQTMIQHKCGQTVMKPEYIPPEGQAGKGGADPQTELAGFRLDYNRQIDKILERFPSGVERQGLGAFLTEEALKQAPNSFGPYMRATMMELRDIVAPDYLRTLASENVKPLSAEEALSALKINNAGPDWADLLLSLESRLKKPTLTADDIEKTLKQIGDEHHETGDTYMAENADLLRAQVRKLNDNHQQTQIGANMKILEDKERARNLRPAIKATGNSPSSAKPRM